MYVIPKEIQGKGLTPTQRRLIKIFRRAVRHCRGLGWEIMLDIVAAEVGAGAVSQTVKTATGILEGQMQAEGRLPNQNGPEPVSDPSDRLSR